MSQILIPRMTTAARLACMCTLALCVWATPAAAQQAPTIPSALDLPADFQVQPSDWLDDQRPAAGWFLQIRMLRGKTLTARNGVFPIHVMKADLPQFEGEPLKQDDLIIAVNGIPLDQDAVDQFGQEVIRSRKKSQDLVLTRWRRGEIATVTLKLRPPGGADVPDLTAGGEPGTTLDWALGPLGVNGWGYSRTTNKGGSSAARQLLITRVDELGPSAGKLQIGDVIVGVGTSDFDRDARIALADAINDAEREGGDGALRLKVWRPDPKPDAPAAPAPSPKLDIAPEDEAANAAWAELVTDASAAPVVAVPEPPAGTIHAFTITLPTLGTYSATAPFDCPKTERIIDNAVAYMLANRDSLLKPEKNGWLNYINGLGLLATGREDVMPVVKALAYGGLLEAGETLSVEKHVGMQCWWWSYKTVFLCEYYLRTRDPAVLPTIEEYATKIAMGQSGAGTWGHTYAARENAGYLHGHLGGYGAINQMGLTLMIALPLAVKCGVENQEVFAAIKRGDEFFRYFIGKGTIPYGDHGAAPWFDDNGKSAAAAIYFDLMNNREGQAFFSEMVLASAPGGRESGHTGHYWSHLWGGIGAARGGDRALQEFMRAMNPIFTLERQPSGAFVYQGNVGEKGTIGEPKDKWDSTGARLLQLCVPRRALYITGKETAREPHLTDGRIEQLLNAGRLDVDPQARAELSKQEILELLRDPLSPARAVGIRAMEERELTYVHDLIAMLDSPDRHTRYGAAEALGRVGYGNQEAARKLIDMMATDHDTQFRIYAMGALTSSDKQLGLVTAARPAIPILLRMAVEPAADDPRRVLQHDISRALFYNGRAQRVRGLLPAYGLDGVDRQLLIPALKDILTNQNGWARSTASGYIYPLLTDDELGQLWADVYRATRRIAPSGIMFASGVRVNGLELLSEHHVAEGMYLAAWYLRWQKGHGAPARVPKALAALERYGTHAQALIPYLEEHAAYFEAQRNPRKAPSPDDTATRIRAAIERIKAATDSPELVSIADHLTPDDIPPPDGP